MSVLAAIAAKVWPYALIAAIVLAGWIYVSHLRESLAMTTAKLHAAQIEIEAATIRAEVVERQHVASIKALAAEREAADRRAVDLGAARDVVSRSPEADDGPVAPVLRGRSAPWRPMSSTWPTRATIAVRSSGPSDPS